VIIERLFAANPLRNYHYLIACAETGEALAIDPLDYQICLDRARERGWTIRQILNTHEHPDHTAGNAALVAATGARVLAHERAAARIGGVDQSLTGGEKLRVGRTVELECLDTPGHTFAHLCLLARSGEPALFSGDTLFNAGVGNCSGGGDPQVLYGTCADKLAKLPPATRVYPGHDYLVRNLGFTLHIEPGNQLAQQWQKRCAGLEATTQPVLTLADELQINCFFRLGEPAIREGVRALSPRLAADAGARELFVRLRELRDKW
jgi:hydroxyacylglutathione hydrolase